VIEAPVVLAGVPIKEVRNPFLIALVSFVGDPVRYSFGFDKLFKEATGFRCGSDSLELPRMPEVSAYVLISEAYVRKAVEECQVPLSDEETNDVLSEIDEVLYGSPLLSPLRKAYRSRSAVLFREGEKEVYVDFPKLRARLIASYPLVEEISYVDDSLIHLAGYLPLEVYETRDFSVLKVNDHVWGMVYGLKVPPRQDWILIWDGNSVSLIELVDLQQEAGAPRDNALREG